jgi:hypothetical protein
MVEVFKTDIQDPLKAAELKVKLLECFNGSRINFDLQDRDRILRVESETMEVEKIMEVLHQQGVKVEILEE